MEHLQFKMNSLVETLNLVMSNLFTQIANNMAPCGMSQYIVDNII